MQSRLVREDSCDAMQLPIYLDNVQKVGRHDCGFVPLSSVSCGLNSAIQMDTTDVASNLSAGAVHAPCRLPRPLAAPTADCRLLLLPCADVTRVNSAHQNDRHPTTIVTRPPHRQRAMAVGRVDAVVQSTDKNFLVPVGGAVVCGPDASFIEQVCGRVWGESATALTITERGLAPGKGKRISVLLCRCEIRPVLAPLVKPLVLVVPYLAALRAASPSPWVCCDWPAGRELPAARAL